MSSWLPSFGKGGKGGREEEAKQWRSGTLGTGDEFFTHSRDPDQDNGSFTVSDVRKRPDKADRGASRLIRLPKGAYEEPPVLARGLKSFDLSAKSQDHFEKPCIDLHTEIFADNERIISPLVQAWLSDEKTQLIYDTELVWIEAKASAKDSLFITTTHDLTKGEKEQTVKFPAPFGKGVEIEVHGWVHGFRFNTKEKADYQLDFWPGQVRNSGFTAHVHSTAERVDITWIVDKKGKKKVASGSFTTEDAKGRKENGSEASGEVKFEGEATFDKAPQVVVAFSQFDLAGGRDLRLGVEVTDVTKDGFKWIIKTRGDNSDDALRSAEATFVALGYV